MMFLYDKKYIKYERTQQARRNSSRPMISLVNYSNTIIKIEYEKDEPRVKMTFHISPMLVEAATSPQQ